jgi:streptomycin 6-kinase
MTENLAQTTIPDELVRRWSISSAFLIADTPSSVVHRVTFNGGTNAVLKSLKPRGLGELPGMSFLAWRRGQGAVQIIERHGNACLLEDAGDTTLRKLRTAEGEDAANAIIVDVIAELHGHGAAFPQELVHLNQHFQTLLDNAHQQTDLRLQEPLLFCANLAIGLLASQDDVKPLHGDLHHDNIIGGGSRGWLAIDPQGLIGDPAYEVANIFGNPLNALRDIIDPARIQTLCRLFSDVLGCPKDKILRYAIAHAGLSICWSLEDGTRFENSENAKERLAFLNVARSLLR